MRTVGRSIAVLALLALGCQDARDAAPTASGSRASAAATAPAAAQRAAAIFSVYFHAAFAGETVPPDRQPLDLREAARILHAADDPMATSRRRRAIAQLTAAGLDDAARCEAVRILLGGSLAPVLEILDALAPAAAGGANDRPRAAPDACPLVHAPIALPPAQRIAEIAARLARFLPPAPCDAEYHPAVITYATKSQLTTATVTTAVRRDLSAVCVALDPQHWDENQCSAFFPQTYIAQKTGDDYVSGPDYTVAAEPNPPPPCTAYADVLFEHFAVDFSLPPWPPQVAWFKNLLDIESQVLAVDAANPTGGHRYTYALRRSLGSEVYWSAIPGGLDRDEGTITIRRRQADPTWTEIDVTKTLRFHGRPIDAFLNTSAGAYLKSMADELPEMACCP